MKREIIDKIGNYREQHDGMTLGQALTVLGVNDSIHMTDEELLDSIDEVVKKEQGMNLVY